MRNWINRSFLAVFTFSVASLPSYADVIYEQSAHSTDDRGAYQHFGQELADDFTALITGQLTLATWRGSYYGNDNTSGLESFTFNLFGEGSMTPGALLFTTVGTASFTPSAEVSYYDYSLALSGPTLLAGSSYWVSIYSNDSPINYAWANALDSSTGGAVRRNGEEWFSLTGNRENHVFSLQSAPTAGVPAPATLALFGLGLVGLGVSRRKRA